MGRDKIHGDEPLAKGNLRILEDSTHKDGEIGLAVIAMEPTIGAAHAMMMTAEGANHTLLVPTRFEDGLAALFLGGEVVCQFEDGVESAEVNHKAQVSRFLCSYIP